MKLIAAFTIMTDGPAPSTRSRRSSHSGGQPASVLRIEPFAPAAVVEFGTVVVGNDSLCSRTLVLENPGRRSVSVKLEKPLGNSFFIAGGNAEVCVPAGGRTDVIICWLPQASGGVRETCWLRVDDKQRLSAIFFGTALGAAEAALNAKKTAAKVSKLWIPTCLVGELPFIAISSL